MLDQIGLNHIFSFENFCFCLLCKKRLSENINLTKEDIISIHLEGEDHASNCKALFKLFFPDPTCDSDDLKYVDILRNLAFDVSWEIGNEASYVCIKNNTLRCLICQENISKMYKKRKKLEMALAGHLKSEIHLNEVRSKASWIHHPCENTNYIAFHKFFVFCSYCQKYLKSPKNTLLGIAADHIETDLENMKQIKLKKEYQESGIKDLCLLFEFLRISEIIEDEGCYDEQSSETSDIKIIDCTHFPTLCSKPSENKNFRNSGQREVLDKPIEKDLFLSNYQSSEPSGSNSSTSNQNAKGLQIIGVENVTSKNLLRISDQDLMTELLNNSSLVKLNEQFIKIKDNRFLCKMCKMFIQIDISGSSLKKHLRNVHNDLLVQQVLDFIWKIKNGCCNSFTDQKEESEKFCSVRKKIALDKKYMSHLSLIENNGKDFVCILCKEIITFSTCGKYVESHFFKTQHLKKMYEIIVDTTLVKEQPDQSSKFSCKDKKSKPTSDKNDFDRFFNTNRLGLSPLTNREPPVSVIDRRLLKVLRKTSEEKLEIKINLQFLILKEENIFCKVCKKLIIPNNNFAYDFHVSKHCGSQDHIQKLMKNATDYLEANNCKPDRLDLAGSDLIVQRFYELVNEVTESDQYDVTASHLLFLIITSTETSTRLSCQLCHDSFEFTVFGVIDHFLSNHHSINIYNLSFNTLSDTSLRTPRIEQPDLRAINVSVKYNNEQPVNVTLNDKDHLGQSSNTNKKPKEERSSSTVQSVLNKVLETAEHDLKELIKSNLHYVELEKKYLVCVLCKIGIILFGKLKAANLQAFSTHFNGKKHRKLRQAFENTSFVEKSSPNPVSQKENNKSNSKHSDSSSSTALSGGTLHKILLKYPEVFMNKMLISFSKNHSFCNICEEIIISSEDGSTLITHCLSERHNQILLKNAMSYVLTLKNDLLSFSAEDKITLDKTLKIIRNKKPFDIITSHVQLLIVKHKNIFCLLCRKQILLTSASEILNHFKSYLHGFKVYALNHFSNYSFSTVEGARNAEDKHSEESNKNEEELLILILNSLPEDLKEYRNDIRLSKSTIYCKLCSFKFSLKRSLPNTISTIQQHLSEHSRHENISTKIESLIGIENYASLSTTNQQCIKGNIDQLKMRENVLFCCICNIKLSKRRGTQFSKLNKLRLHFNSPEHRKSFLADKS